MNRCSGRGKGVPRVPEGACPAPGQTAREAATSPGGPTHSQHSVRGALLPLGSPSGWHVGEAYKDPTLRSSRLLEACFPPPTGQGPCQGHVLCQQADSGLLPSGRRTASAREGWLRAQPWGIHTTATGLHGTAAVTERGSPQSRSTGVTSALSAQGQACPVPTPGAGRTGPTVHPKAAGLGVRAPRWYTFPPGCMNTEKPCEQ